MTFNRHAREEQGKVEGDHLFQWNRTVDRGWILIAEFRGDRHEPGKVLLRNLHPRELALIRFGVTNDRGHVDAQVADEREGVGRIDGQRCQHREHRGPKGVIHPLPLTRVELVVIQQLDPVLLQLLFEVELKVFLLSLQQWHQLFANGEQLLQWGFAVLAGFGDARFNLGLQGRHAHHEELVEVVAEDGAEFGLIQQGGARIESLGQNPLVEGDPAQFPVDVAVRGQHIGTHGMAAGARAVRSAT